MDLREPPQASARRPPDRLTRGLLLVVLALLVAVLVQSMLQRRPAETGAAERHRQVAAKLQAAGALDEAAALYAAFLDSAEAPAEQRARIAFSLGTNYLESGAYEKALRWFYEAEILGVAELESELSARIVHCLEGLGRHHAAQAALASRARMTPDETVHPESDPVVARVGETEIRRSQVMRALDSLPPEIAAGLASPQGRQELLRKFVADELLWRKAVKLEYDRDPEVLRQQSEVLKQLAVARFVEREVVEKIAVDPVDLENYFVANRDRYQPGSDEGSAVEVTFDEARPQVERDYRLAKMQAAYGELIDSELATQDVELFPERMGDG